MNSFRRPNVNPVKAKADIVKLLRSSGCGMTCQQISEALGIHIKGVRDLVESLTNASVLHFVRVSRNGKFPSHLYGLTTQEIVIPEGFCLAPEPEPAPEDAFDFAVVQVRKPAGQWRADHIPAVRSVFDLGVCA